MIKMISDDFNWDCFSIDTETNNQTRYANIDLTIPSYRNGISISDGKHTYYYHNEEGNLNEFIELLKNKLPNKAKGKTIILHNAVFDVNVLIKHGLDIRNAEWFDTMIAAHLLDENGPKGLKDLAKEYLDADSPKYDYDMKKQDFCRYAELDAEYTYKLAFIFKEKLLHEGLEKLFRKVEMPFLRSLSDMNRNGFYVNQELYEEFKAELEDYVINKNIEMLNYLGEKYQVQHTLTGDISVVSNLDINSSLQIREVLFERLGIESAGLTKSGKEKTGKEFIFKHKDKHDFVKMLYEYKIARKLLNGFIEPFKQFVDPDGRIRSSFNDTGARTGRLSSSGPNLQQLPNSKEGFPEVRKLFTKPPGRKLVVADFSGQELRVLAQITGCKAMIDAFNGGKDFHQETADKFGVDRKTAKSINFGIAYGKTAFGFSKDWGTTEEEAQSMLDKYFAEFPEIHQAIKSTEQFIKRNGYVINRAGRKRRFKKNEQGYYPNSTFREGFNFLVQGFSADMIRVSCTKFYNKMNKHPEWKALMLATIHDEIIIECDEKYAEEVKKELVQSMVNSVKFDMPILVDCKIGDTYADCK